VEWSEALFDTISMRSFSNVWYWIAIIVLWSSMSHWVLGVPFDLIMRAKRKGGEAEQDLIDVVRVNVNRVLSIGQTAGSWLLAIVCFAITSLALLGILYGIELAQAILLMVIPFCGVGILSLYTARKIESDATDVQVLYKMLSTHRLWTQVIGMIAIFITAMYGMYHNLEVPNF